MKIVKLVILQSAPNEPNQIEGIGHQKYPTYVHSSTPSPNFRFALRSAVFKILHAFTIFPLTPMLKFQSATKFLISWQIAKAFITLYSLMATLLIIKLGSDQMKTVEGVAI